MIKTNKVLYVGYYKEHSDWGKFSTNNIQALVSAGVDVACRPVVFSNNQTPKELNHIERKQIDDCEICIQHVFPDHMLSSYKFKKNIGILANEFVRIDHSCWIEKLNRMDQIWVPSSIAKECLYGTAIYDKTFVMPFAFDASVYTKPQQTLKGSIESDGKFRFYTITNLNNPNLERVLRCFHSEFDHTDNTVLIIQLNSSDATGIDNLITKVKSDLGLQKKPQLYKKDIIVNKPNYTEPSDNTHSFCDCYISSSSQRSLCIEEFNAMAFGNTPIVSKNTDAVDYFGDKYAVTSVYNVNTDQSKMWPEVNNGKNYTILPCEKEIKSMMRKLYNEWLSNPPMHKVKKKQEAFDKITMFSLESVGQKMKELLYA